MDKILFRGKRIDTGEWVEGYYVEDATRHCIATSLACNHHYDVIPETVGRCTGVRDLNGILFFEGDIVMKERRFPKGKTFEVKFGLHQIDCCGCCYYEHQSIGFYLDDGTEKVCADDDAWTSLIVVGNVHDGNLYHGKSKEDER